MKDYIKLFSLVKPYIKFLFIAGIATVLTNLSTLVQPYLLKYIFNDVLVKRNLLYLNLVIVALVLAVALKGASAYLQRFYMCMAGESVIRSLRHKLFSHLQYLTLSFYDRYRTGDIMARLIDDVSRLQQLLTTGLIPLINDILVIIGAFAWMIYKDWQLTLITITVTPLISIATAKFAKKIARVTSYLQSNFSDLTSILQESLSGIKIIKSFTREEEEINRFDKANDKNFYFNLKTEQIKATQTPVVELLVAIGIACVIWYGGMEVILGKLTTGEVMVFWGYMVLASSPFNRITATYSSAKGGMISAKRIFTLLEERSEKELFKGEKKLDIKGQVEFRNVEFSYPQGSEVLKGISFLAEPGKIIALVGPSGGGKSTIVNLIPRFYEPTAGSIYIDGYPITVLDVYHLREQIGIVPQDPILFNTTIKENILFGKPNSTMEEVIEAARASNCEEFIRSFPAGYETIVGERGLKLSGGQKQRISIARSLLKNPKILILDEATSSLDSESELLIQDALEKLMQGRTVFVIAHRLSTIRKADLILYIEKGRIIEWGSHEELIKADGAYAHMYALQFQTESGVYEWAVIKQHSTNAES